MTWDDITTEAIKRLPPEEREEAIERKVEELRILYEIISDEVNREAEIHAHLNDTGSSIIGQI